MSFASVGISCNILERLSMASAVATSCSKVALCVHPLHRQNPRDAELSKPFV